MSLASCLDIVQHITNLFCQPGLLILLAAWLGGTVALLLFICRRFRHVYLTKWYDLSEKGPNEEMKWSQVRQIMTSDPIPTNKQRKLRFPRRYLLLDGLGLLVLLLMWLGSLGLVCNFQKLQLWSGKYGIVVAIAGVVVSIATIFYNNRLKSRSDNRQAWINSIRTEIGLLISDFPPPSASDRDIEDRFRRVQKHLSMLELYLNPSERIHRTLLALIRLMYSQERQDCDGELAKCLILPDPNHFARMRFEEGSRQEWAKWETRAVRVLKRMSY